MPVPQLTTSSVKVKRKMKLRGYECLEEGRGLQVKQKIRCLKHGLTILAMPHFILGGAKVFSCPECTKDYIDAGDVQSLPLAKLSPDIFRHLFKVLGRYNHKFVKYDAETKTATFKCLETHKVFTTKKILAEYRQGKTDCEHCAKETNENRLEAVRQRQADRLNAEGKRPDIHYTAKGKECVKHGLIPNGGRCLICRPLEAEPTIWSRVESELRNLAKKAGFGIRREKRKQNPGFELMTCAKHEHVVRAKPPRMWSSLGWTKCPECAREDALRVLNTRYPKMNIRSLSLAYGVTWEVTTKSGSVFKFNASEERIIADKETKVEAHTKCYIQKEWKEMGARLTIPQLKAKVTDKFPDIEVVGAKLVQVSGGQKGGCRKVKMKFKHSCGHTWVDYPRKLLQTKHGCPECMTHKKAFNLSKAAAPLSEVQHRLRAKADYLRVVARSKKVDTNKAYSFGYKILCERCNETFRVSGEQIKSLRGCLCCGTEISLKGCRSTIANNWLGELSDLYSIKITGHNSKERVVRVGEKTYRVDGYHEESNTVFEFLGDFWHGNPRTHRDEDKYAATMKRLISLSSKFNVIYVWESDYKLSGLPMSGLLSLGPLEFLA